MRLWKTVRTCYSSVVRGSCPGLRLTHRWELEKALKAVEDLSRSLWNHFQVPNAFQISAFLNSLGLTFSNYTQATRVRIRV